MSTLGSRIRDHRQTLGMSQEALARGARLTQPRISQIERDETGGPLPLRTLTDLADTLGVGLAELVAEDPAYDLLELDSFPITGTIPATLPSPDEPLIGREGELARVATLLGEGGVRLLTLTGPGGVGKTHLAVRVAKDLADAFESATVISLATCTNAAQIVSAIARGVGLRERDARPLRDRLLADLHGSRRLLVLDNLEQVVEVAAPLVAELLAACPRLTLLTTSRSPLRIRGEYEFSVVPLALPEDGPDPVAAAEASPAVQLFVQRAQSVARGLALTPENAAAISRIVRRLDGLPLAIELAAARSSAIPPAAMEARLDERLAFLTAGARDLPERQQTLQAAIGWSHELLDPGLRVLFRRLAIFNGGFMADAAEAVVGPAVEWLDGDQPQPPHVVMDGIAALVDRSLLTRIELPDGAVRFGMLEVIRDYARARLAAANEEEALHRHHLAWCLALAELCGRKVYTAEEQACLLRVRQEDANLKAAMGWSFTAGQETDLEVGFLLSGALADYWLLSGRLSEGRHWLARAIDLSAGRAPSIGRARALVGLGLIEQTQAVIAPARTHGVQGLALATSLGDQQTVGRGLVLLGNLAMMDADLDRARLLHEEALACFRRLDDHPWTALALLDLGMDCYRQGDTVQAAEHAVAALTIARAAGDRWDTIGALQLLGDVARDHGDLHEAMALFAESLDLGWHHGGTPEIADSLSGMGAVATAAGELEKAARLLGAAETLYRLLEINLPPPLRPEWTAVVAQVRAGLTAEQLARSWGALSPEEAIQEAFAAGRPSA